MYKNFTSDLKNKEGLYHSLLISVLSSQVTAPQQRPEKKHG
jgi:hypothetical protein